MALTAFVACPNSPGLVWQKALVRHGERTRDAVVYVAVRLGGWRLSELVGGIAGLKHGDGSRGGADRGTANPEPGMREVIRRL